MNSQGDLWELGGLSGWGCSRVGCLVSAEGQSQVRHPLLDPGLPLLTGRGCPTSPAPPWEESRTRGPQLPGTGEPAQASGGRAGGRLAPLVLEAGAGPRGQAASVTVGKGPRGTQGFSVWRDRRRGRWVGRGLQDQPQAGRPGWSPSPGQTDASCVALAPPQARWWPPHSAAGPGAQGESSSCTSFWSCSRCS